ncbi:MAG TPA: TIGR00282 family metallophosphoesterase, partial [bacterium]|nr:TIGR00282 family metallophosphoesterase [bacterium]
LGIDLITSGNHIWSKKEIYQYLNNNKKIIRPANYPDGVPGSGFTIITQSHYKIAVVNLLGKVFISDADCPFRKFDDIFTKIKNQTNIIIVDFHAEATSEKVAFAYFTASRVSAVIGTHTHIQTNDCRILNNHTAFITDVGMTGPYDNSVIGVDKDIVIKKFLTAMPNKFEPAKSRFSQLNSVILTINTETGASLKIEHFNILDENK